MDRIGRLPVLVIAGLVLAAAMLIPAAHAAATGDRQIAAAFAVSALGFLTLGVIVALATAAAPATAPAQGVLGTLIGVYAGLPLLCAVPFAAVMRDTGLFNAWWEMLSCMTTTGATLYAADKVHPALHLWRATVG